MEKTFHYPLAMMETNELPNVTLPLEPGTDEHFVSSVQLKMNAEYVPPLKFYRGMFCGYIRR